MEPTIICATGEFVVLDKPAGLITHSDGRTEEPSLAAWLLARYPELETVGEPWVSPQGEKILVAGLVHRLDRTTSGIIVAARTQQMFESLKRSFKERRVQKRYVALVHGHPRQSDGEIIAEIMRSKAAPRRWFARPTTADDKRAAITKWRLIERLTGADGSAVSYVELAPETGRTHQLRVHLSSIGHALVADHLYAHEGLPLQGFRRPALHASRISFPLLSGERAMFESPLPEDFRRIIRTAHSFAYNGAHE